LEQHRGVWILNPGSPTERRRAPQHSLIVLDVAETRLNARLVTIA
jgi:predicted phosphodiesterase